MQETFCGFSFLQCSILLLFFPAAEVNWVFLKFRLSIRQNKTSEGVTLSCVIVTLIENKLTDQEEDQ